MDVLMPQLGETVTEGKIVKWFKKAGDAVKPGENLFEIETDKTSMEVPSITTGTLSDIHFQVGETAKVGAVVAVILGAGETAKPAAAKVADVPKATPPSPFAPAKAGAQGQEMNELGPRFRGDERLEVRKPSAPLDPFNAVRTPERNFGPARVGGVTVTPLARRLAGERGIDLAQVSGSGPHGRIVAKDVEQARPSVGAVTTGASAAQVKALFEGVPYEEVPLDGMRATIARRLIEAKQTVPHFYLTADIAVGRLVAMREEANAAAPKDNDGNPTFKLSLNDFIVKAWAAALLRVPAANAVWAGDRILRFARADIGIAVALDGGLITPVLRDAGAKTVTAISAEVKELAARGRDKKLRPDEYQGGSSSISNLGMYGVREFSAIINPPQSSILAVGATRRAPVEAEDGSVKFIDQMSVTVSCDHRVVDGALGAELLAAFKRFAEQPVTMMV